MLRAGHLVYRVIEVDPHDDRKPHTWKVQARPIVSASVKLIRLETSFHGLSRVHYAANALDRVFFETPLRAIQAFLTVQRSEIESFDRRRATAERALAWARVELIASPTTAANTTRPWRTDRAVRGDWSAGAGNEKGMSVTDEDLQHWEALTAKATRGPWKTCEAQPEAACSCGLIWSIPADVPVAAWHSEDGHSGRAQDVLFIAAARTAVPALIDEVKRLRKLDPDAERDRLVLIKDATDAALAKLGLEMDANYGKIVEELAGEKEQLRAEIERLRPVFEAAKAVRLIERKQAALTDDCAGCREAAFYCDAHLPLAEENHDAALALGDVLDIALAAEHTGEGSR